jgi:hypothetical protein
LRIKAVRFSESVLAARKEIVERFLLSARDDAATKSGAVPTGAQSETKATERFQFGRC